MNVVFKRLNPANKLTTYTDETRSTRKSQRQRNNESSRRPKQFSTPVTSFTSSVWDLLLEQAPSMFQFIDTTGGSISSSSSIDTTDCATICQRLIEPHTTQFGSNSITSRAIVRRRWHANEMIMITNTRPRCMMQFDPSNYRARVKGLHKSNLALSSSSSDSSNSASSNGQQTSSGLSSNPASLTESKKTCIESSRHIVTHNGLIIQHPTLKIISVGPPPEVLNETVVEGETLWPLEFLLQLESKNSTTSAQYFDLVLKVRRSNQ